MRCAATCLSILLSLYLAVLVTGPAVSGEEPPRRAAIAPQARTELFDSFDPEQLGRKYLSRFDGHTEFGAVSNFRVTPPGHWFKTFRIKGNISADDLQQLVDLLQHEVTQLANRSRVKIVTARNEVDGRPIALLKALCPTYTVKVSSIRGHHISYQHEQTRGDIDLFVFQFIDGDGDDMPWCVLCAVHEPEVAQ